MITEEKLKELNFPKLESNRDPATGDLVARMYSTANNEPYVVEADGSHYDGKIARKKFYRRYKSEEGRYKPGFWQYFYKCEDGRWFDNSGWICEKPIEQRQPVDEIIEE
jgi:hypothetical protein|tara:strand:- start:21 stop:347 length:327 start_codon:yes stop_codon:yes gene_type:complete